MAENRLELQYMMRLMRRRKWQFCLLLFTTMGVSTLASYFVPKQYEAATTILIQREQMRNPLLNKSGGTRDMQMAEQVEQIHKLITTRSSLVTVIQRLHLQPDVEDSGTTQSLIRSLRRRLEISEQGDDLFQISYRGDTPQGARDIATAVAEFFIEKQRQRRWAQSSEAVEFIEDHLRIYKGKLEASEKALKDFKEINLGQMPGAENTQLSKLEAAQRALAETEIALKEALLKKALLKKQLAAEQPLIVAFTTQGIAETPERRRQRLEAELVTLLNNYSEKYPEVIRVRGELARLKQQMVQGEDQALGPDASATSAMNPVYQKLRQDLGDIDIEINSLTTRQQLYLEQINQYDSKVQTIPTQELEFIRLTRDYNVNEGIYQMLLRRLEEAKMGRELDVNQKGDRFVIVDPAVLPVSPVKPNRVKIMLFSFMIGVMAGLGTVYFLEYSDASLRDAREVEALFSLSVLATIPQIITPAQKWRRRLLNLGFTLGVVFGMGLFIALLSFEVLKLRQPTLSPQDLVPRLSTILSSSEPQEKQATDRTSGKGP
jgi:succinoglycan biosynthesis transport protein ExoP